MRKKVIAGNWKMHNNLEETELLINGIKEGLKNETVNCDVIVCPTFTNLYIAAKELQGSNIKLGAQNMYYEDKGAFTGEISADMLLSVNVEYVILGHSERRTYFGETDEIINKKILKALEKGLKPIFCIGETLEEREKGITFDVIKTQVVNGLKGVIAEQMKNIIIAYEPVWAIGTGKTATKEQAQEVHAYIRSLLTEMYNKETAVNVIIQYGGSVKPENAAELLSQPDIDGALVGGACLKADSFLEIIKAC